MAKTSKTVFVCNECGYESAKWMGKCPACNSWNTFFEQKIDKVTENGVKKLKERNEPKALNSYKGQEVARISTGFNELDRVLGGGIVKGSLILLGRRTRNRKIHSYFTVMQPNKRRRQGFICIWRRISRTNKIKS